VSYTLGVLGDGPAQNPDPVGGKLHVTPLIRPIGHGTGVIIPKACLDMDNPDFDMSYGDYLLHVRQDRRVTISPSVLTAYRLKDV
jgi:hypothetical protein